MYVSMKRHRSASTSRKQITRASEQRGINCYMANNVRKHLNYLPDCHLIMTVIRQMTGGSGVKNLPQHLQHIDKQNKTKVRVN